MEPRGASELRATLAIESRHGEHTNKAWHEEGKRRASNGSNIYMCMCACVYIHI